MNEPLRVAEELGPPIPAIRAAVTGMYSKHPWPGTRQTEEEMGWRLRVLGITPEDYTDKRVVELGCGTGDYCLWYAAHGAQSVTGVDLSDGSLARAREQAEQHRVHNTTFVKQDILGLDFPDEQFDYAYSVGVLMVTGDPFRGFREMVRITKPGGIVILSLYNRFTYSIIDAKRAICRWLGGGDTEDSARWGRRLFPLSMWRLKRRYHGLNDAEISYDFFGLPHASCHTANEVLRWFDRNGVQYVGSFAPLRFKDYLFAFSLPEYRQFRQTFDGFPLLKVTADGLGRLATVLGSRVRPPLPRPGPIETLLCQLAWIPFYLRLNCFTIAGRKR